MHLDVEGFEAEALSGALTTIARDHTVVTTEVTVHRWPALTRNVLEIMEKAGYGSFLVEEIAGQRADIRNLIHLPLRHWRRYERSGTLALALSSHAIFPVDASTIEDYAYPCCRRGGECCGGGKPCCSHTRVSAYLSRAARDGAVEVFSTRTPWWYQKWGQILPTHALQLKVQRAWRNATARDAGLAMSMRFAKAPDGKGYEPVLGWKKHVT